MVKISFFVGLAYIISGISLFFVGMNFFSLGVGNSIKKRKDFLHKLDKFGQIGYFIGGVFTTAVIQSSDATTILSMNLAEDNVLDKSKALALSFGGRIGTTITALLASLGEVGISSFIIGITLPLALFCPKKRPNIKNALLGFGLFFVGLFLLKQGTLETESLISPLFSKTGNNILLFLIGLLFTAVIQSSSATSSILVILTSCGMMDFSSAMFVYLGATVGTTATPLIASIKAGQEAKFIARLYSFSAFLTGIIGLVAGNFVKDYIIDLITKIPKSLQLALFGIIYSSISSVLSMIMQKPLSALFEREKKTNLKVKS